MHTKSGKPMISTVPAEKRAYRHIAAPGGSNIYWDQPLLLAAHALSNVTGEVAYAAAADAYVSEFLERCVARTGLFLWGNHYFYRFRDGTVKFGGDGEPTLCDMEQERGELHEIRPIPPAWDLFARISSLKTVRAVRVALQAHIADPKTGEFDRHAGHKTGCAFAEAGGILVEAASWLSHRTGDRAALRSAHSVADYSFRHRDERTGLMVINPTLDRWGRHASTTEVGHWAGCLLRAASRIRASEWIPYAARVLAPWLEHGYDGEAGRYYGKLNASDAAPVRGVQDTQYQPGDYSDPWLPLFPAHDYPMQFAEACLRLQVLTRKPEYRTACDRWVGIVESGLPARDGHGAYAEHYGRATHFLLGAAEQSADDRTQRLAVRVADEAVKCLHGHGMFRGHPGEDRCDAVDGVGYLLLALVRLATGKEPDMMGSGW